MPKPRMFPLLCGAGEWDVKLVPFAPMSRAAELMQDSGHEARYSETISEERKQSFFLFCFIFNRFHIKEGEKAEFQDDSEVVILGKY